MLTFPILDGPAVRLLQRHPRLVSCSFALTQRALRADSAASMVKNKDYLMTAVGNPDGDDKPNKKFFDVSACRNCGRDRLRDLTGSALTRPQPRVWVREGEKTMTTRVAEALKDFNTANAL